MNDTPDDKDTATADAETAEPLAGERLAAAREELKITIHEVAKELHLDDAKVRALEKNEFDMLGAPVFAKGFLRKYAELVGVSGDDVVADYHSLNRAAAVPPVVGEIRKPRREIAVVPWFAAGVILIAVAFTYWFFAVKPAAVPTDDDAVQPARDTAVVDEQETVDDGSDDSPGQTPVETIQDAIPGGVEPDPTADAAADTEATSGQDAAPVVDDTPEPQAAQADAAAPADPAPAGNEVTLTISFTGDCWTEITDAGGERLFFDLGRDGRVVNVTGQAPLSVLFGNADNVSLDVDGADYPISAANRRGQTARLTIAAP